MNATNTLLTIDIGNTNIDFGLFRKNNLLYRYKVAAGEEDWPDINNTLSEIMGKHGEPDAAIVCSVVPSVYEFLRKIIVKKCTLELLVLKPGVPLKLKNLTNQPEKVGADRIASAYGAWQIYGAPAIVVDLGSAITVDAVSANAEFLGGIIAPGPGLLANSLAGNTAQLPEIELQMPENILGRDTASAIQSGCTYGTVGMVKYLIEQLMDELSFDKETKIVFCGGWLELLKSQFTYQNAVFDPDITLKGLQKIYELELRREP